MSGLLDFVYDSQTFVDLYGILEVEMDAKTDEIKQTYIKMAKKNHPDQGGSSEEFQKITRAYEILFNKETRKEYDLYYLKKSMDEFKGDEITRLRDDFKNFMSSNAKTISKEELDKLYAETFNKFREPNNETAIGEEELIDRINDIEIERKNMQIETSDDTITNFITQHKDSVNINDVFEFIKYKNSQAFSSSIIEKEFGTLDTIPGYCTDYSSFMDENDHFSSNLYSNISDMNNVQSSELNQKLNLEEFIQWKTTKYTDNKLSDGDIDKYLKRRQEEQENIFKDVEKNLESKTKVKEVEKFLKTKHLKENVDEYYDTLDQSLSDVDIKKFSKPEIKKSTIPEIIYLNGSSSDLYLDSGSMVKSDYSNSADIDGMLKFMDDINSTNKQDFGELEKEIGIDKITKKPDEFNELKSSVNIPKVNNVRKREFE